MKIVADTNVLLRHILRDDPRHAQLAGELLKHAELVAIPVSVFCEFVWVLRRGYKKSAADIASAIHRLINSANVVTNRPAVEAGLSLLEAGGDFADGVIAYEGSWLGAEELVSFDSKAVSVLRALGNRARLLS